MNVDFDKAVLGELAYEFAFTNRSDTDEKIKRKLRSKKLGAFDDARVGRLRDLKDTIQKEVSRHEASIYYLRSHHEGSADIHDFDRTRMVEDYLQLSPAVSRDTISWFVEFAVFLYYLR